MSLILIGGLVVVVVLVLAVVALALRSFGRSEQTRRTASPSSGRERSSGARSGHGRAARPDTADPPGQPPPDAPPPENTPVARGGRRSSDTGPSRSAAGPPDSASGWDEMSDDDYWASLASGTDFTTEAPSARDAEPRGQGRRARRDRPEPAHNDAPRRPVDPAVAPTTALQATPPQAGGPPPAPSPPTAGPTSSFSDPNIAMLASLGASEPPSEPAPPAPAEDRGTPPGNTPEDPLTSPSFARRAQRDAPKSPIGDALSGPLPVQPAASPGRQTAGEPFPPPGDPHTGPQRYDSDPYGIGPDTRHGATPAPSGYPAAADARGRAAGGPPSYEAPAAGPGRAGYATAHETAAAPTATYRSDDYRMPPTGPPPPAAAPTPPGTAPTATPGPAGYATAHETAAAPTATYRSDDYRMPPTGPPPPAAAPTSPVAGSPGNGPYGAGTYDSGFFSPAPEPRESGAYGIPPRYDSNPYGIGAAGPAAAPPAGSPGGPPMGALPTEGRGRSPEESPERPMYGTGPYTTGPYSAGTYDPGPYGSGSYGTGAYDTGSYSTGAYGMGPRGSGPYGSESPGTGPYSTGPYDTGSYATGPDRGGPGAGPPDPNASYTGRRRAMGQDRAAPNDTGAHNPYADPYGASPYEGSYGRRDPYGER